ncbi:MAG: AMIN domain-containing protein [Terriglobales bacterium]
MDLLPYVGVGGRSVVCWKLKAEPAVKPATQTYSFRAIRYCAICFAALALAAAPLHAQTAAKPAVNSTAAPANVAKVKSFRVIQEADGPAVEILSTLPLIPEISTIENPARLVIDLPHARIDMAQKRIDVGADQISALRASQFQQTPPVARVVVDLEAPRTFSWQAAGNRLVIHLGKNPSAESTSPFEPATTPTLTPAPKPVIKAARSAGPLAIAADAGSVGSSFTAGADTAVLSLSSGGELRVCPGTTISIIPSQDRHNLLLGMNTGAIEAHVDLDSSTDLVMTPDFRIALDGPGEFDFAFSADKRGDTCVRALPGNSGAVTATELLGDRTYQVKATDGVVFRAGRLDRMDTNVPLECGCPPPRQNVERAGTELPTQSGSVRRPSANPNSLSGAEGPPQSAPLSGVQASEGDKTAAANELHVQVTAPLVFSAKGPPPAPAEDVSAAALASRPTTELSVELDSATVASPPPPPAGGTAPNSPPQQHPGLLGRIKGFFAKIFR